LHQTLKKKAKANRRSLNAEVLMLLENVPEQAITGAQLAENMRKARALMTDKEHKAFAADIERGIALMRREHLR
jgi:hypothetical protein